MGLLRRMAQLPFIPHKFQHRVVNDWLYRQFSQACQEGDLQFLRGRFLAIYIEEIEFNLCITLGKQAPVVIDGDIEADAVIRGPLESFLLLAEQKADPDALFFQRKLFVEGDTDFALAVKNLLYRVDWLPESKRLAHSIHAMQRAFNRLPAFPLAPTKNH